MKGGLLRLAARETRVLARRRPRYTDVRHNVAFCVIRERHQAEGRGDPEGSPHPRQTPIAGAEAIQIVATLAVLRHRS